MATISLLSLFGFGGLAVIIYIANSLKDWGRNLEKLENIDEKTQQNKAEKESAIAQATGWANRPNSQSDFERMLDERIDKAD